MIGKLKEILRTPGGDWVVSFSTRENPVSTFYRLKDHEVVVEIKKASKHRSLSANNFAWVLIDKIAEKMNLKSSEVYQNAIREIGGISKNVGIPEDYFEEFKQLWIGDHLGRQVVIIPGSTKPGWINVKAWKGSSDFDSAQMARFIDSLIQDAEALGIPTIPDQDVKGMIDEWEKQVSQSSKKTAPAASSVAG